MSKGTLKFFSNKDKVGVGGIENTSGEKDQHVNKITKFKIKRKNDNSLSNEPRYACLKG